MTVDDRDQLPADISQQELDDREPSLFVLRIGSADAIDYDGRRKALGMKTLFTITALVCALSLPLTSGGCASGPLLSSPVLADVVQQALNWVGLIDSIAATLSGDPNVPAEWVETYQNLRIKFSQAAIEVEKLVTLGEESHTQTLDAIEKLEQIGRDILAHLRGAAVTSRADVAIPEPRFR